MSTQTEPILTDAEIMQAMLGEDMGKEGHPFLIGEDDFIEAGRAVEAVVLSKTRISVMEPNQALTPQSNCTEKSYGCRDALRWTAGALQTLVKMHRIPEGDLLKMEGERKTVGEILDMAGKALEPHKGANN